MRKVRKYFVKYAEAFSHLWPCSRSRISLYIRNIYILFFSEAEQFLNLKYFKKKCLPSCVRFRCRFHDLPVLPSGLIDRVTDTVVIDWRSIDWSFIHWGSQSVEALSVLNWIGRSFDLFIQPLRMDWSMVSFSSWNYHLVNWSND